MLYRQCENNGPYFGKEKIVFFCFVFSGNCNSVSRKNMMNSKIQRDK